MSIEKRSRVTVLHLGKKSYAEVWELQKRLQQALIEGRGEETIIFCEHDPVITLGKGAIPENVLLSEVALAQKGIAVFPIERGGDVTFHGPGQLVCYPIIDLSTKKKDVGWYMRSLEEITIRTLADFGIKGERIAGKTGVWIMPPSGKIRKIGSQGVRISRWKTLHGFSLNVFPMKEGFSFINPCGFTDIDITSIAEETSERVSLSEVEKKTLYHLCAVLEYTIP